MLITMDAEIFDTDLLESCKWGASIWASGSSTWKSFRSP
jgi:hypothetical protein